MNSFIFPEIFDGSVRAFFTKKSIGADTRKICSMLSIGKRSIYLPVQKHTDKIQIVKDDLAPAIADAVITTRRGILIGVRVADCVPIIISDSMQFVAGAVHAGWRSTAAQILKKTLRIMIDEFHASPENIKIAFGPSIRWSCYQVGFEVKEAICMATGDGEYYVLQNGRCYIDLSSANKYQAISIGIPEENIWISQECTYCNPREYYSFRYSGAHYGSQGGFIGIFE